MQGDKKTSAPAAGDVATPEDTLQLSEDEELNRDDDE